MSDPKQAQVRAKIIAGSIPKRRESDPETSGDCGERVSAFLRARHPVKTAEMVEAETGGRVPAATVKRWLSGASAPSLRAGLALVVAYGPDFLAAALVESPGWLSSAHRAERLAALTQERARLDALAQDLEARA